MWRWGIIVASLVSVGCGQDAEEPASSTNGGTAGIGGGAGLAGSSGDGGGGTAGVGGQAGGQGQNAAHVQLLSAKTLSPTTIALVFNGPVKGTNKGFAIHGTRSNSFVSVAGFGTPILEGTVSDKIVYGEVVTVTYDEAAGDLQGVRWFKKELVINTMPFIGGASGAGKNLYVTASATGSGDGSLEKPFSASQLSSASIKPGDRVNFRRGAYSGPLPQPPSGTPGNPIIYQGYRDEAGDLDHDGFHPAAFADLSEANMPLFDGGDRAKGTFLDLTNGKHDVVVKSIQAKNFKWGIRAVYSAGAHRLVFDNVALADLGTEKVGGAGFLITLSKNSTSATTVRQIQVINSYVANASTTNYWIDGDHAFIYNSRSYSNNSQSIEWDTDYMFVTYFGREMVWRKLHAEKAPKPGHGGHGFTFKADSAAFPVENSLIDDCTIKNVNGAIEFRHSNVRHNLARNVRMDGKSGGSTSGGVVFRDGASFNHVDACQSRDQESAYYGFITFLDTTEDGGYGQLMEGNVVSNCIFHNTAGAVVRLGTSSTNKVEMKNNYILNNTIVGAKQLFNRSPATNCQSLVITNNLFSLIGTHSFQQQTVDEQPTHNNYFDFWASNGQAPTGMGNTSADPLFAKTNLSEFDLSSNSPVKNAGADLKQVPYDAFGTVRKKGLASMGAIERD